MMRKMKQANLMESTITPGSEKQIDVIRSVAIFA